MSYNILHYKDYTYITPNDYSNNITINNDKNYFILKTITNFIYVNGLSGLQLLYSYIENLSNFMINIKYNNCNYDHILDNNDIKLIYNNL